jgi:galactonate dehydratase
MSPGKGQARRRFLKDAIVGALSVPAMSLFPSIGCSSSEKLELDFVTIPDPDGWHPSLRLKGDWLIVKISDGVLSGYGEASHSKDDEACRKTARTIFEKRISRFPLSLESLKSLEEEVLLTSPDFVTATAWSALNQALYDLLAKREQVPVWKLFQNKPGLDSLPLYTTINRSLKNRSQEEYLNLVGQVKSQGFGIFKCAPFEEVTDPGKALETCDAGLNTLSVLRDAFPQLGIRVDFHERFSSANFSKIIPQLEKLKLDWIEEPFGMGNAYTQLQTRTQLKIAGGELFWGETRFRQIVENRWVHVIMPDVKHVGGFGPLLKVLRMAEDQLEISPHNPSGPVSSAASLHAAALYPKSVHSLEFAFDSHGNRRAYGERVEKGRLFLSDEPGWGINPEISS